MRENDAFAFRKTYSVDQAGVIGAIRKDHVFGPQKSAQQSNVCRVSGRKVQGSFSADPPGEILFEESPGLIVP